MRPTSTVRTGLLSAALAKVGLTGGATAATASAPAAPGAVAGVADRPGTYYVRPYENVNNRTCPYTSCAVRAVLRANVTYIANCWVRGQTIRDNGYVNDIWIQIRYTDYSVGYSSAIYFRGDARANLPPTATC
jgi:hypothetical protein